MDSPELWEDLPRQLSSLGLESDQERRNFIYVLEGSGLPYAELELGNQATEVKNSLWRHNWAFEPLINFTLVPLLEVPFKTQS